MRCPFCTNEDTQVKDSRPSEDNAVIRRRRFCTSCGSRFTTFERVQLRDLLVIKKSGNRVAFDRDKLARSIKVAIRKRQIDQERIETMINRIVQRLETAGQSEISSAMIGEQVMRELFGLDPVAYVRFASVYRDFCDANDFEALVRELRSASSVSCDGQMLEDVGHLS